MMLIRQICLVALASLGGHTPQAELSQETHSPKTRHQSYRDTKARSSILPLGEALVFAGIGTVSVVWMRRRRLL